MKKWFKILGWGLFVLVSGVLLSFVNSNYDKLPISKLIVKIDKSNGHSFITENQVVNFLNDKGIVIDNMHKEQLDIEEIESYLQNFSAAKNVEVYCYNNGELHIEIEQRNPIARVLNQNGYLSYYLDEEGKVMSLCDTYVARVPVFSGYIKYGDHYRSIHDLSVKDPEDQKLDEIYCLAKIINKDKFLKSQIVQVYVNKKGEYEMIPSVGNQRILFGNIKNAEKKFNRLKSFYTNQNSINAKELNIYDTLNLMYNHQIVCSKK